MIVIHDSIFLGYMKVSTCKPLFFDLEVTLNENCSRNFVLVVVFLLGSCPRRYRCEEKWTGWLLSLVVLVESSHQGVVCCPRNGHFSE